MSRFSRLIDTLDPYVVYCEDCLQPATYRGFCSRCGGKVVRLRCPKCNTRIGNPHTQYCTKCGNSVKSIMGY